MSVTPWRYALENALRLNDSLPEARYFQLATVTSQGKPTNFYRTTSRNLCHYCVMASPSRSSSAKGLRTEIPKIVIYIRWMKEEIGVSKK